MRGGAGPADHRRPASRRAPSDRAHCASLVATRGSGPADHPLQARRRATSDRSHCAHLVASSRSGPADHLRPGDSSCSQRSSTLCPPGSVQQIRAGGLPLQASLTRSQRSSILCPPGKRPARPGRRFAPASESDALPVNEHKVTFLESARQIPGRRVTTSPACRCAPSDHAHSARRGGAHPIQVRGSLPAGESSRPPRPSPLCPPGRRSVYSGRRDPCSWSVAQGSAAAAAGRRWRRRNEESKVVLESSFRADEYCTQELMFQKSDAHDKYCALQDNYD